jgi:outer membrane immunogenic protein
MKKLLIAIIAGAAFCGVPAFAADMAVKAPPPLPPPAPVYSWTGFYVGGDVGALWTKASGLWNPLPTVGNFGEFPISGNLDETAFTGGLHAGYNWQFAPTWVVGIEGDWSWTNANGSFTDPWVSIITGVRPGSETSMSIDPDWLATVQGRIGYLVTPNALLYFTGGGAWADVKYSASAINEPAAAAPYAAATSFSKTVSGYVLGGGLEWALWNHWSVRAEYLFYHLNATNGVVVSESTGNFPANPSGFSWGNLDIQTARVGASYKF